MITFLPSLLFVTLLLSVTIRVIRKRQKNEKIFNNKILRIFVALIFMYLITGFFHSETEGIYNSSIDYFAFPIAAILVSFLILNKPDLHPLSKRNNQGKGIPREYQRFTISHHHSK